MEQVISLSLCNGGGQVYLAKPDVIESIETIMARSYHKWRYTINLDFVKFKTVVAALSNPPPLGISLQDWVYVCGLFSTEKFKARSETNKRNRDKLKTIHCAGTKAFSKIRFEKGNLGLVELYEVTHSKAGSWVNESARDFYEILKEHKTNAEVEGTNISDEQLPVLTFGRKSGYVRGLGSGPKPTLSVTGKRTRAQLEQDNYEATKHAELAERSAEETRKERAELAVRMKILEAQQVEQAENMQSQYLLIQQLFGSSMAKQQ